jgi:uncharacterized protein (DUF1697 family)
MKYYAFLRAINVGGHTVKMAVLKQIFESLGFTDIETFLASGNVGFETTSTNVCELEKSIEDKLQGSLGFEVATFLRTYAELNDIARFQPFSESAMKTAVSVNVAFLKEPLDTSDSKKVLALDTPTDEFLVHGQEVYWLVRTRQSESSFSNAVLEKTLGKKSTIRGIETIKKMVGES